MGRGSIYYQKGSRIRWMKYYVPGQRKPNRESTGTDDRAEAERILKDIEGQIARGQQITRTEKTVRLEVGTTKNKHGRLVVFPEGLLEVIRHQQEQTSRLEKAQGHIIPWVFHRNGKPIKDFREAWHNACERAGCTGTYCHDFRRTGARNMIRAGIPERVVMDIIGHKTRAMLDRYNIRNTSDLQEATRNTSGIDSGRVEENQRKLGERQWRLMPWLTDNTLDHYATAS
jgi:integrase